VPSTPPKPPPPLPPPPPSGTNTCVAAPDFDGDGAFRLADAVFTAEVWKGSKAWSSTVCRAGDFDKDGAFRLADAVFVAEVWAGKKTFSARRLLSSSDGWVGAYGALKATRQGANSLQVHATLGTARGKSDVQWKTVEVAFVGGSVASVAAEHGLAPLIRADGKAVAIGDLSGSGRTYPSGLAFTVTFDSGVDMSGVDIDFSSPVTSIISDDPSRYPTVSGSQLVASPPTPPPPSNHLPAVTTVLSPPAPSSSPLVATSPEAAEVAVSNAKSSTELQGDAPQQLALWMVVIIVLVVLALLVLACALRRLCTRGQEKLVLATSHHAVAVTAKVPTYSAKRQPSTGMRLPVEVTPPLPKGAAAIGSPRHVVNV